MEAEQRVGQVLRPPSRVQHFEEPVDTRAVVSSPDDGEFTSELGEEISVLEAVRAGRAREDGVGQGGDWNGS